jgi:hypothetical protein
LTIDPIMTSSAPVVTVTSLQWEAVKLSRKKKVSELVVSFSGALNPGDANDIAAYALDSAKGRKKPTVYAKPVPLTSASYNPATNSVSLMLRGKLPKSAMQLTIQAADLLDAEGRQLNGNDDGQPGGNFAATLNSQGVITMVRTIAEARTGLGTAAAIDAIMNEAFLPKRIGRESGHS